MSPAQNEVGGKFLEGSDLAKREKEVLQDASKKLNFNPQTLVGRSHWWGSDEIGAFHYQGTYHDKPAILKIQGVKPTTSEIYMIQEFTKMNHSKIVRPPHLYAFLNWDDEHRYEALVLENIEGNRIVNLPTNSHEVNNFFATYEEYRKNCIATPWVTKPEESINQKIETSFKKWSEISQKIYPNHPLRKDSDNELIAQAVSVLIRNYANVDLEFVHGHLSDGDLIQVDNQVVLLSNLYWSWRPPFYDSIFAYHWYRYHLNDLTETTPKIIKSQKKLWKDRIFQLPKTSKDMALLKLALLERAAAGLNLDSLSAKPDNPITEYLVEDTRQEMKDLLQELG
jgi:hypothetical protein